MLFVDSHVNLHSEKYEDDVDAVIANARAAGVEYMLTISDKLSSTDAIANLCNAHSDIWRSVGVHPHYANEYPELSAEDLITRCHPDDVVGVGECGLDFHYEYSDRDLQLPVFKAHIKAAQESGLPLIIHTRNADNETQKLICDAYDDKPFVPLLHCYTGGPALAKAALEIGGYVAFSGIITFKNASDIRDIAADTPLERIIIETDCPYLAPVPMRGRRNEPAYLVHVAEKLAEVKGISVEEVAQATSDNFFKLFSRAKPSRGRA